MGGGCLSGNRVLDAALIAYERGRLLPAGPFVGTNVVAYTVASAGSDELLPTVVPGLVIGGVPCFVGRGFK